MLGILGPHVRLVSKRMMTSEHTKDALVGDLLRRMAVSAEQGDILGLQQCITDAWNGNVLPKLADAPGCRQAFESLTRCPEQLTDSELALILADLGRLPESVWSSGGWGAGIVTRLLTDRIPGSFLYGDAKQRTRTAKVVQASGVPIGGVVLARAAAEEKRGEEARREWTSALVRREELSTVFELLGSAVAETETVADARSDRVHRLLRALGSALPSADIDVNDAICDGVSRFIRRAHACAKEGEYGPSARAAEAMFDVAILLLRYKYRLGAEAQFFLTVAQVSRWLPGGGWRRITRSSPGLKQLRRALIEGLLLLLEKGLPDPDMLEAHSQLCPSGEVARDELRRAERSARDVSPGLRAWLVTGGATKTKASSSVLDETDDLSIAMALIDADQLLSRALADSGIVNDLRFRAPVHVDTIVALLTNARDLAERVTGLAARRQLSLFGSRGDVVEFSPHAYRLPDDSPLTRRVQIVTPGVEKSGRAATKVVVPALVASVS